jgi:hypothetical protein
MTHSETLKRQLASQGIPLQMDQQVAALLNRGIAHKLEAQLLHLRARICDICGRELTDPDSIMVGVGPECRKIAQAERETGERFPVGCEVRIPDGFYAGRIGIVVDYTPRRHRRPLQRPFMVSFASGIDPRRSIREAFSADELERVEAES